MSTDLTMLDFYAACNAPRFTSEIESWNALDYSADTTSGLVLSVGLFGYDMTCLAGLCAQLENTDGGTGFIFKGYCALIESRGLDGLAFGIYAAIPTAGAGWYYCAGFRNDEPGNKAGNSWTCLYNDYEVYTYYSFQNY